MPSCQCASWSLTARGTARADFASLSDSRSADPGRGGPKPQRISGAPGRAVLPPAKITNENVHSPRRTGEGGAVLDLMSALVAWQPAASGERCAVATVAGAGGSVPCPALAN